MKTLLRTLFFLLLTAQICFTQWGEDNFSDSQSSYPESNLKFKNSQNEFVVSKDILNNTFIKSNSDSVSETWINRYASGLAPMGCSGNKIVIDNDGNVYVAGSIDHPEEGSNFYTIKYNSAGELLWAVQYNGSQNSSDAAKAIALDALGNIYVTGTSSGEYTTIKYSPSGVEVWVAHYYGPVEWADGAQAIAIDPLGNVYVTGTSDMDYATIKYDQYGNEVWVARYNGPANHYDAAYDISLDADGNVYICGGSMGIDTSIDWAIIKYNSSGTQQWIVRYNGNANYTDWTFAIEVDESGNSYVAGMVMDSYNYTTFTTMKISTSGTIIWVTTCGEGYPNDVVLDSQDNLYVIDGNKLVKYSIYGSQLWVKDYIGEGPRALTLDDLGNIYVTLTGSGDFKTIKYSSTGTQQWVAIFNSPRNNQDGPSDIALDYEGNVYVTGVCSPGYPIADDCATIRYSQSGTEDWLAIYSPLGRSIDYAKDMVKDQEGNIYVTGNSFGYSTANDITTIKYDPNGIQEWILRYAGTGYSDDKAEAICIDSYGNIYVTGSTSNQEYDSTDYITIKYDQSGVEQWVSTYNGPGNSYDAAIEITVDASGNIYVTGSSIGTGNSLDYATIKYNSDGLQQWIRRYNGPTNGLDQPKAIDVDSNGNIYITGRSEENNSQDGDLLTIKYDLDGNEVWTTIYDAETDDDPKAIKVDNFGNVYLAGVSESKFTTIKYNSSGIQEWMVQYCDTSLGDNRGLANALAIDEFGNVYVTGGSLGLEGFLELVIIKYTSDGTSEWIGHHSEPGTDDNIATHIVLDLEGNIYLTGVCIDYGPLFMAISDYLILKYNPLGNKLWTARYSGPGSSNPSAICVDPSGNVIVTGSSNDNAGGSNYLTIKYIQNPSSIFEQNEITISEFLLSQNFPNPFNPNTKIEYSIPQSSKVIIKVFDIIGNEIETLVNEEKPVGTYELTWNAANLPSGVYFYQLKVGSFVETKKMILLK